MPIINRIDGWLSGASTGTAGTTERVTEATAQVKVSSYSLVCFPGNSGTIYFGGSAVATNGIDSGYAAGDEFVVPVRTSKNFHELQEVYFRVDTTGDGFDFVAALA
jgi:hypothetical protein|tara:strand:+ start:208 stop:525 length:318 start_codon:yes stop_codon:yes gene_type:complete